MVQHRISPYAAIQRLAEIAAPGLELRDFRQVALDRWAQAADEVRIDDLTRACLHAHDAGLPADLRATWMAVLASREGATFEALFPAVVRDFADVQSFVRVMRSGCHGSSIPGDATPPRREALP